MAFGSVYISIPCILVNCRAIKSTVRGFPRPLLDLSKESFAKVMDSAFGRPLHPPFDPYANEINFLLASYVIPYVGLTGYVGANPHLQNAVSKKVLKAPNSTHQSIFLPRTLHVY